MTLTRDRPGKQQVVGVGISTTSYTEVVEFCRKWVSHGRSGEGAAARYICVTSVHGVITARDDGEVREILNSRTSPPRMGCRWSGHCDPSASRGSSGYTVRN